MLTQKTLKQNLFYDSETGIFTRLLPRPNAKKGSISGHSYGHYLGIGLNGKNYLSHRLAWLYVYGEWPAEYIDHINGIKTDNRIINLRNVSIAENAQNIIAAHKDSVSGFLGVFPARLKWAAQIRVGAKKIHIGTFETKEIAHAAYLTAKRELHEFCTI